jgi:putative acetyltransferase
VREARSSGAQILFLVGEPDYYRRFGFDAAAAKPFASPYAGPYFQALVLVDLPPVSAGVAQYAPVFSELG